jgi:uncharacterized protein YqhQ
MKKKFIGSVLFSSLLVGIAGAAAKGVHFQRPMSTTYDYVAVNNIIDKIMQVLVAAIIILVLILAQGIFFFLRDFLRQK